MNEENNRKGPGVFYAVVGVATLVVAIIGATFAYFSAQASTGTEDIKGGTLDIKQSFSVEAVRVYKDETVASDNLVPSDAGANITNIKNAMTAKCVNKGYTGCHIYKITAKSGQTLNTASLNLTLTQTGATDVAAWKYVTFTGEGDAAALVEGKSGSFNVLDTAPVDLHGGASVTGGTDVVYYLMIYLENKNASQNEPGDNLATGSYVGKVTFQAAGGTVSATFAA